MRVLIAAGGTGGHVMPALAVARALRERGDEVLWLGTATGLEARVVPAAGFALEVLRVRGLRGSGAGRLLAAPLVLTRALWGALGVLRRFRPGAVLAMGGFAAAPGGVAAWLTRVPLVVHEQNARPGLTNRLLGRFARECLAGFAGVRLGRKAARAVGNPVRAELLGLPDALSRGVDQGGLRLLVLGGSQGARGLNTLLPHALKAARAAGASSIEVRHQTGAADVDAVTGAYRTLGVPAQVTPFIEDMAGAYGWANLVVCRAGALTLAELCAVGVGSVLVPFPHAADDHQTANAHALVQGGAAHLYAQHALDAETLGALLMRYARDGQARLALAQAARLLARPDATAAVVACLAQCAGTPGAAHA